MATGRIADNIRRVCERIAACAIACGRAPEEITLLAVSKTFPVEIIGHAIEAGLRHFGESRVQEAEPKIQTLRAAHPIEWHLVGHLQTNKARRAAELFDVIHSIDSIKLAGKLNQASLAGGKCTAVLVEVNLAKEESKFGAHPEGVRELVGALSGLKGLRLQGLMTIPPFFDDPELARPYFVKLRKLRDALESELPGCLGQRHLSMGMSQDFEVAIQEGATIVRIGTAVFGERIGG